MNWQLLRSPFFWLGIASILAAAVPLAVRDRIMQAMQPAAWPSQIEGRALIPLTLSAREESFLAGFPGAVRRYTDGEREIIVRWVTHASRRLHPAADCYRAMGYDVSEATVERSVSGVERRCFAASRGGVTQQVCEGITDSAGAHWTDVSAWYWASTLGRSTGPWWFVTTAAVSR